MIDTIRKLNFLLTAHERRQLLLLFLLMLVGAMLEVASVGAIPLFVAAVNDPARLYALPVVGELARGLEAVSPQQLMIGLGVGLAGLFAVKNGYLALLTHLQARFSAGRQASISTRLFRAYLFSPYPFHLQRNSAELLRNVDNEARIIGNAMFQVVSLTLELCVLLLLLIVLLAVAPAMTTAVGVTFGATTYAFQRFARRRTDVKAAIEQRYQAEAIKALNEGFGGIKDVKVLGREQYFADAYARKTSERAQAGTHRVVLSTLPRFFLETLGPLAMVGAALALYLSGRPPEVIVPMLTLLAVAVVRLMPSFQRIAYGLTMLRWGNTSLGVVHADLCALERHVRDEETADTTAAPAAWNEIAFETVTYAYPGGSSPAVAALSLRIRRGDVVGFVGASGAGKSTLVDLLLGLLTPTGGRVLVGGRSIAEDVRGWQRQIGYIPQHIFLTDDTIKRNVAFGVPDEEIDEDAVWRSLEGAHLGQFLRSLPAGLETVVGERGVRLSGGQRQRIGIARAVYHNPAVLVMDEATSALDHRTEAHIVDALERLRGRHTLVIVAHRMSTVRRCDTLFVLSDGRLVATGGYDELRESNQDFRAISA